MITLTSGITFDISQYLINRPNNADPSRAAFEVFCGKPSLSLHRCSYGRVFTVFLNQQPRDLQSIVVLLHLPLETWLLALLAPTFARDD